MILPILVALAVAYWLAAPDPVTAGARTASGTGVKAAGAGIRDHWSSGRDSRALTRTKRRDRWSKGGGFWRNLLRLEHGAVITGEGVKGAAGIMAAAVKPVPAAVKAGWVSGRDRHRAKAGNRPVPVALDPPWWRREQPQVQPGEQAPEQVEEQAGDSPAEQVQASGGHAPEQVTEVPGVGEVDPDAYTATTRRLPDGSVRGELFYAGAPEEGEQLLTAINRATEDDVRREFADIVTETQRDDAWGTPARIAWVPLDEDGRPPSPYGDLEPERLDTEEQIRSRRTPAWNRAFPEPLAESDRRFWTARDGGHTGPLDQDGRPGDPDQWPFKTDTNPTENSERAADMRGIDIQDPKARAVLSAFEWDDDEAGDAAMARARDYEAGIPEVLLREAGRCPHQTAYGHKGVASVEFCGRKSKPGNPYGECAQHERDGVDEYGTDGYLAAVRRNTAPDTTTEGDPVFTSLDTDLDDLTTVQDFALKVADMAEESDFAQLVEFCKNASDEVRDFGADMAGDVAEFEEVAAKIGDLLSELVDAATKVKERGAELVGG